MNLEEAREYMIKRYSLLLDNISSAEEDFRRDDEMYWKARISELSFLFYDIFEEYIR
jgi:hypothetical protein